MSARDQLKPGAFSSVELAGIRGGIKGKYARVAQAATGNFTYPTGREGAVALEYEEELLQAMPDEVLESFCGVGNPFRLGAIPAGGTVLDIGCGAGFDLIVASRLVGTAGRIFGVDLTPEMIDRARRNLVALNISHIETLQGSAERLPLDDGIFDVIISNGVINLSPCKPELFAEIFRVCRPGGRLQFADVILEGESPAAAVTVESWSQ